MLTVIACPMQLDVLSARALLFLMLRPPLPPTHKKSHLDPLHTNYENYVKSLYKLCKVWYNRKGDY